MKTLATMTALFLTLGALGAKAHAETKLTVHVLTASPQGFLVDSTLVAVSYATVSIDHAAAGSAARSRRTC